MRRGIISKEAACPVFKRLLSGSVLPEPDHRTLPDNGRVFMAEGGCGMGGCGAGPKRPVLSGIGGKSSALDHGQGLAVCLHDGCRIHPDFVRPDRGMVVSSDMNSSLLGIIVFLPLAGALGALACRKNELVCRRLALTVMLADLVLVLSLFAMDTAPQSAGLSANWLRVEDFSWMDSLGIRFTLALDGISLMLILLTTLLGALAVLVSWNEITDHVASISFFPACHADRGPWGVSGNGPVSLLPVLGDPGDTDVFSDRHLGA